MDSLIDALAAHLEKLPARELEALRPRHLSCLLALFPRLGSVSMGVPLDPTPPDAREIRRRAAEALKELLRRASLRSPVAILLDDLHLADADSVRLLSEVLTPPDAPALLLVCSAPPGHPSVVDLRKALTALGDAGPEYRQLVLGPLSQDALVELAHTALGALDLPSRSLAQAIASEATGSPFVAVALARHAARPEAGRPETIDLASVLSGHLAALGTTAAQALELLAVAGRPTREHLLHTALGAGSGGWLQELRRHGLVRRAARGSVWLTHGRIGDAVRARMTAVTARLRHRQLAQAGEVQSLDDPAWLAEHWAASGDDARGAGRALEAADLAGRRFAFRRAAELYHFAETHMGPDDPRRGETARRRGEALVFAGHGSEAADAYLEAIRRLPPTEARPVARAAVCQLLRSGRSAEGTALARDLLRDAGVPYPETRTHTLLHLQYERARLRIRGLELRAGRRPSLSPGDEHRLDLMGALFRELTAFDPERAALLLSRFLRDALGAGDPNRVRHGLAWAAFNTAWLGGAAVTAKADELLRRADSLPGGQDSGYAKGTSLLAWAGRFLFSGWHRRARDLAAEAESQFRSGSVGSTWEESIAVTVRLAAAEFAGPLSDIVTESEVRAVQATEREDRLSQGMLALARTFAHLMMDDVDGARDVLHAQQAVLGPTFGSLHFWSMTRTADALLYQGLGRAALDHYQGTSAHYQSSILARAETMRMATANRRARAALMAFHETGDGAYLKSARRDADHLRRM
ncbi:MAG: AAA family ATPase, partial [Deltaproteobacteria bacterium]|nr:AAA family ATPase [Deltaproteobacteria bacterium]